MRHRDPRCESSLPDCGPVVTTDTEGVPLCHFEDGKPWGYSENPAAVCSETAEGLAWVLDKMREAIALPAFKETDFDPR